MANGPAFIYLFLDRCMHPILDKHFLVPKPTDLYLFIFLQPVACIQALISIPQCLSHYISIYFLLFNYPPGTANFIIDHWPWHAHRRAEEQFFHLPSAWLSLSGLMVHDTLFLLLPTGYHLLTHIIRHIVACPRTHGHWNINRLLWTLLSPCDMDHCQPLGLHVLRHIGVEPTSPSAASHRRSLSQPSIEGEALLFRVTSFSVGLVVHIVGF